MPTHFVTTFTDGDIAESVHVLQYADSLNKVESGAAFYREDIGAANAYKVSFASENPIEAYAAGIMVHFLPATTNTGAATLEIAGPVGDLGPVPITKNGQPLQAGDIQAGQIYALVYNDTGAGAFNILGSGGLSDVLPGGLSLGGDLVLPQDGTIHPNDASIGNGSVIIAGSAGYATYECARIRIFGNNYGSYSGVILHLASEHRFTDELLSHYYVTIHPTEGLRTYKLSAREGNLLLLGGEAAAGRVEMADRLSIMSDGTPGSYTDPGPGGLYAQGSVQVGGDLQFTGATNVITIPGHDHSLQIYGGDGSSHSDPRITLSGGTSSDVGRINYACGRVSGGRHSFYDKTGALQLLLDENGLQCQLMVYTPDLTIQRARGVVSGGSAPPTFGSAATGGTNQPASAAQNCWVPIYTNDGNLTYVPGWR